MAEPRFSLTPEPVTGPILAAEHHAGAIVVFEGLVRNENEGRKVQSLEYEAFGELASSEGEKVLREAVEGFGLVDAACRHRVGLLHLGEIAVRIEAFAPHRKEAFRACEWIIDEIKRRVPIWKKEYYQNGDSEWLNPAQSSSVKESDYYDRQTRLSEIGPEGQAKLKSAKVLVVGAGGLGCPALLYLAGAGVGTIGIADDDVLSLDNLHRQVIYSARDAGKAKAGLAAEAARALNPFIDVRACEQRVTRSNVMDLIADYDLVLDCTDNFSSKFLLNDACCAAGKVLVQASIYQFEGQLLVVDPRSAGGCLRCIWPEVPEAGCVGNCAEVGVLGSTAGVFGSMQAAEALKILLGIEGALTDSMLLLDMRTWESRRIARKRNADCRSCGGALLETEDLEITVEQLNRLANYLLVDIREPEEWEEEPFLAGKDTVLQLPMGSLDPADPRLVTEKPLVIVCGHGIRSYYAADMLRRSGVLNSYSLAGGVERLNSYRKSMAR